MPCAGFSFQVHAADRASRARASTFHTPHGPVDTPAFMPVGTQGTVKGLTVDALRHSGTQMILANTYHLTLRPGEEVVRALGGLHAFSGWNGPMLTDSGGFQLFSLAHNTTITEKAAVFQSHIDGTALELSPERAVAIQETLGADVAMVLDHVVPLPNEPAQVRDAAERTLRWARRALDAKTRADQALFAIVQGGLDADLRRDCARQLAEMDFPGYAVGGLGVGETPDQLYEVLDFTVPALPVERPRYLMGLGRPEDLLQGIRRGIDLFDCVLPTRNGRNAMAFTSTGPLRLRNLQYARDEQPLERDCPCAACRHSRGYLRHLFLAGEMLGPILVSLHNVTFYQRLLSEARAAIQTGSFGAFADDKLRQLAGPGT